MRPTAELMTIADVDRVAEIERLSFSSPWSSDAFIDELTRNDRAVYVVLRGTDGEAQGYGGMWLIFEEAHVTNVAVHPDFRRRGVGMAIMLSLMSMAARRGIVRMTLEVRASNASAQALYEKLGFVSTGIRPRYYLDNLEDAMVMWLDDLPIALQAAGHCQTDSSCADVGRVRLGS
ncbi:MAG: ribosomal protein S18-alanine N-acetyltransferase [Clostridia bacterium]|nr:ribosomal protein S18-alanine N-acetyltransferase [Clostridia bacterium]